MWLDRLPNVDVGVPDDQSVGAARSAAHHLGDARLFRPRDQMVNENAEPTPRAGPELGDDLHQVVDATEMFDDDTFDSQVRSPYRRDEFSVVSALDIDPAGPGHPGTRARQPFRVIPIAASTRESFTVNESRTAKQYRFVLPGPSLTVAEQEQCLDELRGAAASAAFVVASGSLPPGVAADYYQRVADICRRSSTPLILDTSGGGLQHISSGVFLLKASVRELRECVGSELLTEPEQLAAAHELIDRGRAEVVVVSLGSQGALLATRHASHRFSSIPMTAVSGVGAGDAMVAAITVGLSRGWSLIKSVRLGNAAGAAMLLTPGTAACNRDDVERFFELAAEPTEVGQDQYVWHPIVNPEASP